jgi:tripartite-type tricarboxylate transporter receptor subunit TctC
MIRKNATLALFAAALLTATFGGPQIRAEAQDYYEGKTITIFAGRPPGGSIDSTTRLVSEYFGRHVPGTPTVLPDNRPGAGGVVLGNYIHDQAPANGLELGIPGRTSFILSPITGNDKALYKLENFGWIGSAARSNFMLWVRGDMGITSLEELKASGQTLVVGGSSGRNSDTIIPIMLQEAGLSLKVIAGYPGTGESRLAMERGEIDAILTGPASFPPDFLSDGKAIAILQTFREEPDMPIFKDVVTDPLALGVLTLLEAPLGVGLAMIAPPGTDDTTLEILRTAYMEMVTSEEYVAAANERGLEISDTPQSGAEIAEFVAGVAAEITDEVLAKYLSFTQQ